MKIEVNKSAKDDRIKNSFDECVKWITANASQGIEETELMIDVDIAYDVRDKLEAEVEGIRFMVVDRRPNQYTGQMQSFTGKTVGNIRYYKVKLKK